MPGKEALQSWASIRYYRRGYGKSSAPDRPFSDVSELHRLLRHFGTDEAYLLGIFNRGKVTLEFSLEHPGMVAALVLVGPGLGGYSPSEKNSAGSPRSSPLPASGAQRRLDKVYRVIY